MARKRKHLRGLGNGSNSSAMTWLESAQHNFDRIKGWNPRNDCNVIEHYTDVAAEATAAMAVASEGSAIAKKAGNLASEAIRAQRQAVQLCRRSALKKAR